MQSPSLSVQAQVGVYRYPEPEPSEDMIAFLFDHVSERQVSSRAEVDPAYQRLAAMREMVLARLNANRV